MSDPEEPLSKSIMLAADMVLRGVCGTAAPGRLARGVGGVGDSRSLSESIMQLAADLTLRGCGGAVVVGMLTRGLGGAGGALAYSSDMMSVSLNPCLNALLPTCAACLPCD